MILLIAGQSFAGILHDSLRNTLVNNFALLDFRPAIGLAAYGIPYALFGAAYKWGGHIVRFASGAIAERGKGISEGISKYRSGKAARNIANMKAGTRTNNRAINALTARATTASFGLGRRGRAAYTDKMNLAAAEHAKSAQGMAAQHNDDVLKAQTYGSAIEAHRRMANDWGMSREAINQAIAGARANGGFGAARQVYALKAAAATGTVFDNDTQMYSAIARVSKGNEGMAAMLYGDMRASSERAGRNDLKAGHSTGTRLISDIMRNGDAGLDAADMEKKYGDRFDELGLEAARGADGMTLARNKPKSIQNVMKRLDQARARHEARLADPDIKGPEREYSIAALGQIRAKMENMQSNMMYGPEVNAEAVYGTRERVRGKSEAYTGARSPGNANNLAPAINAQQRAPGSQPVYEEERLNRQQYDPATDPRRNPDAE